MDITLADHIQAVAKPNFSNTWDQLGQDNEFEETYALSELHTIPGLFIKFALFHAVNLDAVKKLQEYLGLAPCEHSDKVADGKSSHTLLMGGVFRGGHDILARIRLVLDPVDQTVTMNITVR